MDYSVIKNEVPVNATIWMNLEKNMLKEDTKGPYCMSPLTGKPIDTHSRVVVASV